MQFSIPLIVFFRTRNRGGRLDLLRKGTGSTILKHRVLQIESWIIFHCLFSVLQIKKPFGFIILGLVIRRLESWMSCFLLCLKDWILQIFIVMFVNLQNTHVSFPISNKRSLHPYELIHSDIWGPSTIPNILGSRWFVSLIDDYTRVTWIYLLKQNLM